MSQVEQQSPNAEFRFAFLLENAFVNLGVCNLIAILQQEGIKTELFIASEESDFWNSVQKFQPHAAGFSLLTGNHIWAKETAGKLRKAIPGIRIVFGGLHPTLFPEIIRDADIDAVCRGEAEQALPEYVRALRNGQPVLGIKNLWIKTTDGIQENELRPLIEDLDAFPDPDRECYQKYPYARDEWDKYFNLGRGCAYQCSFCANHQLMRLYHCGGHFVRRRKPERIINEIAEVVKRHPLDEVIFVDETFNLETHWLRHFLELYQTSIKLPFISSIGIETTDAEQIRLLKAAGCKIVIFGVECGNEKIRNTILKKPFKNEKMLYLASVMHKSGLKFLTANILGNPGDTLENAWETVDYNIRLKPSVAIASFLMPFPKTDIHDLAVSMGLMEPVNPDDLRPNLYIGSMLNLPEGRKIKNLQRVFTLLVRFPWMKPMMKRLVHLPPNPFFEIFFLLGFAYYQYAFYQRDIRSIWAYGKRNIAMFLKQNRKLNRTISTHS